jgi:hypothetical protein
LKQATALPDEWVLLFKPKEWQRETMARQLAAIARLRYGSDDLDAALEAARSLLVGRVGLALSGRGFRAALFHVGVLARLAELDVLRHVEVLSCVSGGSILGALYYLELRQRLQKTPDHQMDRKLFIGIVTAVQDKLITALKKDIRTRAMLRSLFSLNDQKNNSNGIVTPLRACGPAGGSVAKGMKKISYRGYRFPPEIIQQAIWLYLRFTLSLRDVPAEQRVTTYSQYSLSSSVNGIKDIEAQSLNGISVQKIFFQPDVNLDLAIAQIVAGTNSIRALMPAGIEPPIVVQFNASSVPVLQISLSSDTLNEQQLYDYGIYKLRQVLAPIHGVTLPTPAGGKYRQIMVDIDPAKLLAKGLTPLDIVNAVNAQNLTLPSGTAKIATSSTTSGRTRRQRRSTISTTSRSNSRAAPPSS